MAARRVANPKRTVLEVVRLEVSAHVPHAILPVDPNQTAIELHHVAIGGVLASQWKHDIIFPTRLQTKTQTVG